MANRSVWTMCGMCTVRCPIRVETEGDEVSWIEGNPHLLEGALCAKGSAGTALLKDEERPLQPMIRKSGRGAGRWEQVSWYAALDYVAEKLQKISQQYGPESLLMSCRGGPFVEIIKTFCHAFGSPNFSNHDSACGRNVHHASLSLYGLGRKGFVYDIKKSKHLVLFGRNILASLRVAEVNQVLDMLDAGGKLTYVDVRQTQTGLKASRFFQVRPGTDYALALGMIHEVLRQGVQDQEFIDRYVADFDRLVEFITPYSAEWAANECGVKVAWIKEFVTEIGSQRPRVVFHPGWMLSRYRDSFHASRALQILNVLMGNIEVEGGQIFAKGPSDCGVKGLRAIGDEVVKPTAQRADGVGWKYPHFDKGPGLFHLFYETMRSGKPYPIKGLICVRHDPFTCFPDPQAQKEALDNLDLLVSLDTHYSEFGWYSDVILPESTYLERDSIIATQKGPKPRFIMRRKALDPRHDTKDLYTILKQLADRLGFGHHFPGNSMEEVWKWQLAPTGFTPADFQAKGFVSLADKPVMYDRDQLEGKFKTPSGKIEMVCAKLSEAGLESLKPYESPHKPPKGQFRLVFGRSPIHAHSHTINNPLLHELMPENTMWINRRKANKLGIADGDLVEVTNESAGVTGTIKAHVTDFIHPEAVYTVHGFGRQVPLQTRAYHAGLADQKLMKGLLQDMDPAGGGLNLCECFVTVTRSAKNPKRMVEL
ncbi:molybdopterin-dependent oxidoreductase [Desulfurivibrio sp. D14AmB]|uniref:molybdopterin-containing oxidoreductase family protein n=1 Tax=Desulfurivibrio sp. D14AmB TaxID=3374370 RepID=UPI00376F0B94